MHIDNVDLEHFPANEVAQRLLTYVTRGWYDKSYVGKWIFEVMGLELDTAIKRIEEAQSQSFPETAAAACARRRRPAPASPRRSWGFRR